MKKYLKKRCCKCGMGLLMACIMFITSITFANAFATYKYHMAGKAVRYSWGDNLTSPDNVIRKAWDSAFYDWLLASGIVILSSANTSCQFNSIYISSTTLYGRTYINSVSGSNITSFEANLNASNSQIISDSYTARSTANHEIGHLFGLDDIKSGTAIMNTNRNRHTIYTPQDDDKNGIEEVYK